jgi:hypothetical protein
MKKPVVRHKAAIFGIAGVVFGAAMSAWGYYAAGYGHGTLFYAGIASNVGLAIINVVKCNIEIGLVFYLVVAILQWGGVRIYIWKGL